MSKVVKKVGKKSTQNLKKGGKKLLGKKAEKSCWASAGFRRLPPAIFSFFQHLSAFSILY
jgi:hypothetical protein